MAAVRSAMESLGWPVILADDESHADFNRSASRNRGVEMADTDIVVIHDADLIVPPYYLTTAVTHAAQRGGLHYPYRHVLYLDELGTQERLAGNQTKRGNVIERERNAHGGCTVMRRAEYLSMGGYDERFTGWGYEDLDFYNRATISPGVHWGVGDAHHMWHPRPKRDARTATNYARVTRESGKRQDGAFVVIPTHTQPRTLAALLERAGLPCIVVHTDPASDDIPHVINVRDHGPVNIQRWWNAGIREAESRGANVVILANHDAVPADSHQLPHMVDHLRASGATIAMAHTADTTPEMGSVKRTGHTFALHLSHGIRPDERFQWYYGDTLLELQARTIGRGVVGAKTRVAHRKVGPHYPTAFTEMVERDRTLYHAESVRLLTLPDVVYRVRPGDDNEELRYSLRSLVNVPHRRVWMVGHKPSWCSDAVHHLPGDRKPGKWAAIFDGIIRACEHPDITDRFILIDDDQFVMIPLDEVPVWHLGSLADRLARITARRGRVGDWQDTLATTIDYLRVHGVDDPVSYEVHAPIVIDKATALPLLIEAQGWPSRLPPQARSVYGNLAHVGGECRDDTKILTGGIPKGGDIVSTTDASFKRVSKVIAATFPQPCRYEVSE